MSIENQLKWQAHYNKLCKRGQARASSRRQAKKLLSYTECHHIKPKCMGGSDEASNLVYLSAREHFIAHQLLVKIYPNYKRLVMALHRLMTDKQGNKLNGKDYEWIRKANSKARLGRTKNNDGGVRAMAEKLTGRSKDEYEYLQEKSLLMTGRTKENNAGMKSMAEKLSGRTKDDYEYLRVSSEKMKGRTKENDERVKKMADTLTGRTKETHPGVKRQSEKMTGRTKENHEGIKIKSEKQNKLSLEHRLLLVKMRKAGMTPKMIVSYFNVHHQMKIRYGLVVNIYHTNKHLVEG
jgi:hypothetical protein